MATSDFSVCATASQVEIQLGLKKTMIKCEHFGGREMAQLVKCLPCRHKDLSLIPESMQTARYDAVQL